LSALSFHREGGTIKPLTLTSNEEDEHEIQQQLQPKEKVITSAFLLNNKEVDNQVSELLGIDLKNLLMCKTKIRYKLNLVNKSSRRKQKPHTGKRRTDFNVEGGGIQADLYKLILNLNTDLVLLGYLSLPEKQRETFCKAVRLGSEYSMYRESLKPDNLEGTEDGST
jgi:hypothetical protein